MSKKIYLASKSPRRQELLKNMGFEFELKLQDVDESFPSYLNPLEVAEYISKKKADAFDPSFDELYITADTIVIIDQEILGKPQTENEAFMMLKKLKNKSHLVSTGVTLKSFEKNLTFSDITEVTFTDLSDEQLWYYILEHQPFDKAGSYGIQDWIGLVGVKSINGSYTNVMGLPTEKLFKELNLF